MHKQATRAFRKTAIRRRRAQIAAAKIFCFAGLFANEQHKIFAKEWLLVGHQSQIPNAGDFFVATVANESLIVVRDQQNQIRAFYNVCRHRGSRLKEEACGHASAIQCPYHSWTYALDGRLMGAPHMDDVPGFEKADYSLASSQSRTWEGFIFVNLKRNPELLEKWFASLGGQIFALEHVDPATGERIEYDVHAN
jgi:Rieske 2Fe-2S family protein